VPLNRPALSLGAGPRSVQDARRWVVSTFNDIGRDDLVECAEIGVSELVTNALLHGGSPIQVRVRGTREHPRVEVRDGSAEPPVLPGSGDHGDEEDDVLLTFGRGLSIVARASDAWGAEIEDDGKTVWFAPKSEFADDDGPGGAITGVDPLADGTGELPADLMEVELHGVPLDEYVAFQRHFRELRREVRLLALAHENDYPLAKDLSEVFDTLGRPLTLGVANAEVSAAIEAGRSATDLRVVLSQADARAVDRFMQLLDLTDEFCREERMLSLARTRGQREFQNWFLGEFFRQGHGAEPGAWNQQTSPGEWRSSVS